jgi:hypothetical protein
VESAINVTKDNLQRSFDEKLSQKISELEKSNNDRLLLATTGVKEQTDKLISDVKQNIEWDMQFGQALTFSHAERYEAATAHYFYALGIYLKNKDGIVSRNSCVLAICNLFKTIYKSAPDKFKENAQSELKKKEYKQLKEELALAAVDYPRLAPILHELAHQD